MPKKSFKKTAPSSAPKRRISVVSQESSSSEEQFADSELSDGSSQSSNPTFNNPKSPAAGRQKTQVVFKQVEKETSGLDEQGINLVTRSSRVNFQQTISHKKGVHRRALSEPSRGAKTPNSPRKIAKGSPPRPGTSHEPPRKGTSHDSQRPGTSHDSQRPGTSYDSQRPEPSSERPRPEPFRGRRAKIPRKQSAPKPIKRRWLDEIRKSQTIVHLLIPRLPFSRLLGEAIISTGTDFRITKDAIEGIQEAAELYLIYFFADCNRLALHSGRATVMVQDMKLIFELRKNWTQTLSDRGESVPFVSNK